MATSNAILRVRRRKFVRNALDAIIISYIDTGFRQIVIYSIGDFASYSNIFATVGAEGQLALKVGALDGKKNAKGRHKNLIPGGG